jgi:predicted GNAT family acetyltransferase
MVAVLPEARGQGLSGKLIAHALADAVDRGVTTSTLVATPLGRPVYERLGFRGLGVLEMWERRLEQG